MSPAHKDLAKALKQLRQASTNLSSVSANTGHEPSLRASQLVSMLANALEFGHSYLTASSAVAFDQANDPARKGYKPGNWPQKKAK